MTIMYEDNAKVETCMEEGRRVVWKNKGVTDKEERSHEGERRKI